MPIVLSPTPRSALLRLLLLACALTLCSGALAEDDDPPTRVARLAYEEGAVSFQPGGAGEWVAPPVNRPITSGDQLWADQDSRAELQLDGSLLRLSSSTAVAILNLADHVTQVQLSTGTLMVRVRRLDPGETYEIDTPNLALTILQPGLYRVAADPSGNSTVVAVRQGQGQVTGGGSAFMVQAGDYTTFTGVDELQADRGFYTPQLDDFEAWGMDRDRRWDNSPSARYVSADVVGYQDLDDQGTWNATPDYGYVWFPRDVEPNWAPYHYGHWAYVAPWGYTWVDDRPWGFAPFHYGRWISWHGNWGWVPAPPPERGVVYVRPVYAPALVAWVGVGAGVAWFALGPREVYVPSYPVSRRYCDDINLSNTRVNRTVVENVYNTTIINRTVNITHVTYVNRNAPNALMVASTQAFTSAQPLGRNRLAVDPRTAASAPVRAFAPADVPSRQAFLGAGRASSARPPQGLQTRAIVARVAPPPPPPSFEQRRAAIQGNAGRPLSLSQVRQLQPAARAGIAPIRVAPAARAVITPTRAAGGSPRPGMPPQRPQFNAPQLNQRQGPDLQLEQQRRVEEQREQQQVQQRRGPDLQQERQRREQDQQEQQRQAEDRQRVQQQQAGEQQRQQQLQQQAREQQQVQQRQAQEQQQAQQRQAEEQQRQQQRPPQPQPTPPVDAHKSDKGRPDDKRPE